MATAAVMLIKTDQLDTIRVLQLCYLGEPFPEGAAVAMQPIKQPDFPVSFPTDPGNCTVKTTCYGVVERIP
ncbi:hypothetical protein [Solirubrum puertoriconensis]|nr:hypothetical protein [Solirubrum puertoriconensis]